jgi:hypothetical protein
VPRTSLWKFGLASSAAVAAVILAISSVGAHATPAPAKSVAIHIQAKSLVGTLLTVATEDAIQEAAEQKAAADAAAALLAKQQQEAAEAAAEAAQDAAEAAAAAAVVSCESADDLTADAAEKIAAAAAEAAAEAADAAETPGTPEQPEVAVPDPDAALDATEATCKAAQQGSDDAGEHHDNESAQGAAHENGGDGSKKGD